MQQPPTATVGSSIADKATVTGGFNPTGTVTFNLFNNPNGTGTPLFTDTEPLVGGMATSAGYIATATGTDYWVATYNGDSNNNAVTSGTASEPVVITPPGTPDLAITKVADQGTVTAGSTIGFTVTITNTGGATATGLTLSDPLPPGASGTIHWSIASQSPANTFTITGPVGSQVLTLVNNGSATLAAGNSLTVHITSPTAAADVSGGAVGVQSGVSSATYLGVAGQYGVLYEGTGGRNLSITNVVIGGNVGVGGTGHVAFSGPGAITGRLDLAAGNTGQVSNSNGSNYGPTSVNYNVAAVTTALTTVNNLSSSLAGLGTSAPLAINGTQTINESAGELDTVNGVTYRIFNVTSYSSGDGKLFTINGDGSGDPVVLNFAFNSNVNLGGDVALTGNGLNDDKVIWNFTSSGKNINLNNNASSFPNVAFHGIILAPSDNLSMVNANLSGRIFGGNSGDMQIVSGDTLHAPVMNTATVTASNVTFDSDDTASATITITGSTFSQGHTLPQLAAGSTSLAGVGFTEILSGTELRTGTIGVAVDLPAGPKTAAEQAAISAALATLNTELSPLGISLLEVAGDQAQAATIHLQFAATSPIGGVDQGVLAAFETGGTITMIEGWNWYLGGASGTIASNQYDFQTIVTHELGHALGLGESADPSSAMYLYLSPGQIKHDLSANDLHAIQQELGESGSDPVATALGLAPAPNAVATPTAVALPVVALLPAPGASGSDLATSLLLGEPTLAAWNNDVTPGQTVFVVSSGPDLNRASAVPQTAWTELLEEVGNDLVLGDCNWRSLVDSLAARRSPADAATMVFSSGSFDGEETLAPVAVVPADNASASLFTSADTDETGSMAGLRGDGVSGATVGERLSTPEGARDEGAVLMPWLLAQLAFPAGAFLAKDEERRRTGFSKNVQPCRAPGTIAGKEPNAGGIVMRKRKRGLLGMGLLVLLAGMGLVGTLWLTSPGHGITARHAAPVRTGVSEAEVVALRGAPAGDYLAPAASYEERTARETRVKRCSLAAPRTFLKSAEEAANDGKNLPHLGPQKQWLSDWCVVVVRFDADGEVLCSCGVESRDPPIIDRLCRRIGL
jgi:uncharacterized repeat protein (TIGR01451 family)